MTESDCCLSLGFGEAKILAARSPGSGKTFSERAELEQAAVLFAATPLHVQLEQALAIGYTSRVVTETRTVTKRYKRGNRKITEKVTEEYQEEHKQFGLLCWDFTDLVV